MRCGCALASCARLPPRRWPGPGRAPPVRPNTFAAGIPPVHLQDRARGTAHPQPQDLTLGRSPRAREQRKSGFGPPCGQQVLCFAAQGSSQREPAQGIFAECRVVIRTGVNRLARRKHFFQKRVPVQSQSRQKPHISIGCAKPPVQITPANRAEQSWKKKRTQSRANT